MNRGIYALRDLKIKEYLNLIHLKNEAEAERYFIMLCSDSRAPMSRAPKDYGIFELGHLDTESGEITPHRIPKDVTPHSAVDMAIRETEAKKESKTNG